jgi:hypothetical protein
MPESGVTAEPCCSLIVTVLLEGSDQVMVKGWPATTWRPPLGMLMALFCARTVAASARRGAINFIVAVEVCDERLFERGDNGNFSGRDERK